MPFSTSDNIRFLRNSLKASSEMAVHSFLVFIHNSYKICFENSSCPHDGINAGMPISVSTSQQCSLQENPTLSKSLFESACNCATIKPTTHEALKGLKWPVIYIPGVVKQRLASRMRLFELSEKSYIYILFCFFIAKFRNIVKWQW